LALPAPVAGISLVGLLSRPGPAGALCDSPVVIAAGYIVRFLPIGILLLVVAVRRVPREIESAARIDGCDWLAVQRHVYWPAVAGDAAIVWLITVILCFAEVGATKLVAPPGWNTASVRAFTLIHGGVDANLALLAVLSTGIILVLWLFLVCLVKRRYGQPGPAQRG
jgi:iron(III) transport system permease protein